MATIAVQPTGERARVVLLRSLLNTLLAEGVAIDTVCGGKAVCGRCLVRVLEGSEHLSPPTDREKQRLAALGAGPGSRLACQAFTRGDVTIEVANRNPSSPA